jgi:short-subunit dehydrogenase
MAEVDFATRYGPWALIAGGSEGLGAAFAHRLAERGLNLVLVARKPEPLEVLAEEVRRQHGREARALALDLTAPDADTKILSATEGCEIGLLVYNAGADSNFVPFLERTIAESERMVALNVLTPMRLVRNLAPAMVARKKGGIILVSSMASMAGYPGNLIYSSTKAFSNLFAEGLWHSLGQDNVDVLGMIIGFAATPAMARMGFKFDGPTVPADPYQLVDEGLAHIDKGPTLHAGGTSERADYLRSLPRAEAVQTMAGQLNRPK